MGWYIAGLVISFICGLILGLATPSEEEIDRRLVDIRSHRALARRPDKA